MQVIDNLSSKGMELKKQGMYSEAVKWYCFCIINVLSFGAVVALDKNY